MSLAVPAHGSGSLSSDEGGVSGAVHGLAGERDWMLGAGLVRSDHCGGIRAVGWTLTQALQQSKLASTQWDEEWFVLLSAEVEIFVECRVTNEKVLSVNLRERTNSIPPFVMKTFFC